MRGRSFVRACVALAALALLWRPAAALAQHAPGCPAELAAWADRCRAGGAPVRVAACPSGHALLAIGAGRMRVDLARDEPRAFVQVGALGISPIGEFTDWNEVPAADRAAFDELVRCVRARPDDLAGAMEELPAGAGRHTSGPADRARDDLPLPWRAALGLALALALLVRRFGARGSALRALPLLGVSGLVFAARRALAPEAYLHQNGQGPFWIAHALGEPSDYGPGYAQVFFAIASPAADPDGAVFVVQGLLCALVPAAAYAVVRGAGAPRVVAVAALLGVALSPLHARLAQSESYFATMGALLALSAAILGSCVRPEDPRWARVAGLVSAGLLIAQAALIHPLGWLAAAVLPGVVAVGSSGGAGDTPWERAKLAALAAAVIGAVVLALAGPDLVAVLTGPLGAQWLGGSGHGEARTVPLEIGVAAALALAAPIAAWRVPSQRGALVALAVLSVVLVVAWIGDRLGAAPPTIHRAHAALFLLPALAALGALPRELVARAPEPRRGAAGAAAAGTLLVAALALHGAISAETWRLPTDVREALLVRTWREHLREGAVVAYLERAGNQIVGLPLYRHERVRIFGDQPTPDLTSVGRDVFLYRTGICTTPRGREHCDALERAYVLEPRERATLPAIPSMEGFDYDRDEVEVVLYRVRDRRMASTADDASSEGREGR